MIIQRKIFKACVICHFSIDSFSVLCKQIWCVISLYIVIDGWQLQSINQCLWHMTVPLNTLSISTKFDLFITWHPDIYTLNIPQKCMPKCDIYFILSIKQHHYAIHECMTLCRDVCALCLLYSISPYQRFQRSYVYPLIYWIWKMWCRWQAKNEPNTNALYSSHRCDFHVPPQINRVPHKTHEKHHP